MHSNNTVLIEVFENIKVHRGTTYVCKNKRFVIRTNLILILN